MAYKCDNIAILMATYNGEKYVAEQIESILRQSNTSWELFIHDDGSKDSTMSVLQEYAARDSRIHILDYEPQGGAKDNFFSLLSRVDAPYYMFCDQDDVWLENKVSEMTDCMLAAEQEHPEMPVVVGCDLRVVNGKLHVISPSFWAYQHIVPEWITDFYSLAATNIAPGCAMMFNRKARENTSLRSEHVQKAIMHDSWVCASALASGGIFRPVRKQLILYRQHDGNTIGAVDASRLSVVYKIKNMKKVIDANLQTLRMLRCLKPLPLARYLKIKFLYKRFYAGQSVSYSE